jgi:hypothetical protein
VQETGTIIVEDFTPRSQTIATNADFTLTYGNSPQNVHHTGTLTADRAVTLATTFAPAGARFKITRTGSGAFNLNVGISPLKALTTNTWAIFEFDGTVWFLGENGNLL